MLNNLGLRLAEVGDTHAALDPTRQAVMIYQRLAEAEPVAYLPNLAKGLWGFAWVRAAAGTELDEALSAAEESAAIYRKLTVLPEARRRKR